MFPNHAIREFHTVCKTYANITCLFFSFVFTDESGTNNKKSRAVKNGFFHIDYTYDLEDLDIQYGRKENYIPEENDMLVL